MSSRPIYSQFDLGSFIRVIATVVGLWVFASVSFGAEKLQLEILPFFDGKPVPFSSEGPVDGFGRPISITRLDYIVSGLQFQSEAGDWFALNNWYAYFSLGEGKTSVSIDPAPYGKFVAVSFNIGVPPAVNASDPNQYPDSHPLNPQVNGLHWGWQGGYVFCAIEGHYEKENKSLGGFSYHIAGDSNLATVTVPIELDGEKDSRISLALSIENLFAGENPIDVAKTASTHSREGDSLATLFVGNFESSIELLEIGSVLFQENSYPNRGTFSQGEIYGTPYLARVTERFPKVQFPADNPLTEEGVYLGELLFNDIRLSRGEQQSCVSCHSPDAGFSDQVALSVGVEGKQGVRNAMPLFNLAWSSSFFWDGRATTLREQALMPIQDHLELNESLDRVVQKLERDDNYPQLFEKAFGSESITPERIGLSLEQFMLTQIAQDSKFDRAARGEDSFTEEEKRGLELFVTEYDPKKNLFGADCFHCHGGNLFTNNRFANNGLDSEFEDLGRYTVTRDEADLGKFKTPSLRNIALTAPYMHDGRFDTLEDVVDHYSSGVNSSSTLDPNLAKHPPAGIQLSSEDKQALVAFLNTLTEVSLLNDPLVTLAEN